MKTQFEDYKDFCYGESGGGSSFCLIAEVKESNTQNHKIYKFVIPINLCVFVNRRDQFYVYKSIGEITSTREVCKILGLCISLL